MGKTSIEWTTETWNPVRGCSRVSEGCRNCYAERQAARFCSNPEDPFHGFVKITPSGPRWTGRVELIEHMLDVPLRRKKPTTFFVNSMSDLFHEALPDEAIDRIFAVMALCPQHTFQILTKRAERMEKWASRNFLAGDVQVHANDLREIHRVPWPATRQLTPAQRLEITPEELLEISDVDRWPLPNVWLGVSVENRKNKDRIDHLRETPAAVRFLSIEPLLEDIGEMDLRGISWVIIGGESGPGARPFDIAWARQTIAQCKAAGVACFVKQVGSNPVERGARWRIEPKLRDRKGGDMDEWPADLRVREIPR